MERRVLILEFNEATRIVSCFHFKKIGLIRIKLETDESPKVGQFLTYDEDEAKEENGVLKIRKVKIEEAREKDYITLNEDGTIKISSWIAFSSDRRHRTFDRKVAFADWYGLVDCSEVNGLSPKFDAYKTFIVVKDLDYENNQTQLFKVALIKGKLSKNFSKKEEYDEFIKLMKDFEEDLLDTQSLETCAPHRPSRSIDGNRNENNNNIQTNGKKKNRSRSRQSNKKNEFGTGPPINVARYLGASNTMETPILPSPQLVLENRVIPPTSSTNQPSQFWEPTPLIFKDFGLVMHQTFEDEYIVWLREKGDFAILETTRVGLVLLGSYYEFEYTGIQNGSSYSYEITKKQKKQERLPFNINIDREVYAGIHVDLCSPNTRCQVWSFYTGVPFFNSPEVGFVTMADYVDSQGINKSWQEVLRIYLGNPCAQNMYCICRVVKQRVPEKMSNPFMMDEFRSTERYSWQVIKIQAAKEYANDSEEQSKRENLREDLDQYEEEDEVARQKRQNRANVRFEQVLFSSGPSSSLVNALDNFRFSQSPYQPM